MIVILVAQQPVARGGAGGTRAPSEFWEVEKTIKKDVIKKIQSQTLKAVSWQFFKERCPHKNLLFDEAPDTNCGIVSSIGIYLI